VRKLFLFILGLGLSFVLASCREPLTYDEVYNLYVNHIELNESDYQFSIDYFNAISTETVKSVVLITKSTTIGLIGSTTGSGVIIKEDLLNYYVLTNHHVAYSSNPRNTVINIEDYSGKTYRAELLFSDSQYDLAVLRIKKNTSQLSVISVASENARQKEKMSIIGHPNNQVNAITLGTLLNYSKVNLSSTDTTAGVTFEVIITDAPVMSGSSGSVVLNSSRNLVGIVFAGNFYDDSTISHATFAIPVEKIHEFLEKNNFILGGIIS